MDKVIAGQDPGGITKAQNWQGSGGYRFYEVAPTLINKDAFDEYVINEDYDANMLAAAVALHEGFHYQPDGELFWKQSVGNENSYLFVTTRHLNSTYLDSIKDTMEDGEYLIFSQSLLGCEKEGQRAISIFYSRDSTTKISTFYLGIGLVGRLVFCPFFYFAFEFFTFVEHTATIRYQGCYKLTAGVDGGER